jgi:hypothetical protein
MFYVKCFLPHKTINLKFKFGRGLQDFFYFRYYFVEFVVVVPFLKNKHNMRIFFICATSTVQNVQ